MKQITLTDEDFETLKACVEFTHTEEAVNHEFYTGTTEEAIDSLRAAIGSSVKDVARPAPESR
jgi:hypothetical protein